MKKGFSLLRRNLPGILWTSLIVLLMGVPGNRFPEIRNFWDWLEPHKMVHVFLFGVWAYLILRQNSAQYQHHRARFLLVVFIVGIALSVSTELLQEYVFVNRSGSFFDALANITGMVFGLILYMARHRKKSDVS